jgi:hypothetical protein
MRILLSIGAILTAMLLTGCARDVNTKEAVRAAVVEYLTQRAQQTGLNMDMMNVEIGSVSFQKDQATANAFIKPKAGGEGMQIPYVLDLKGGKWVVRRSVESGAGGHGTGMAIPPSDAGKLPDGHPAVPPGAKQ